eukprot:TRINITY_DN6870_c0_g3_i7.p1 TRINITY_DN6870_c0_g3~~TRINITY_DN6870_c0_g3_i7.p1  ORF type:complete len:104 (-),score=9.87 TRINITY_DN6870_c0_g3_i7:257-568(-)
MNLRRRLVEQNLNLKISHVLFSEMSCLHTLGGDNGKLRKFIVTNFQIDYTIFVINRDFKRALLAKFTLRKPLVKNARQLYVLPRIEEHLESRTKISNRWGWNT